MIRPFHFNVFLLLVLVGCSNETTDSKEPKETQETVKVDSDRIIRQFRAQLGVSELFDEKVTLEKSLLENKPILLYFTGFGNITDRKLDQTIFSDLQIIHIIENNFIFKALYVDDKTLLPREMQDTVKLFGRKKFIQTIGDYHFIYEMKKFEKSSVSYFVILNSSGEILGSADYRQSNVNDFLEFLNKSNEAFKK